MPAAVSAGNRPAVARVEEALPVVMAGLVRLVPAIQAAPHPGLAEGRRKRGFAAHSSLRPDEDEDDENQPDEPAVVREPDDE